MLDLKEFNSPFSISVPAEATANKSMNNSEGTQVQFDSMFFFYEIAPWDNYTVADVLKEKKSGWQSSVKDFKIEKEDANGFIYSYTEDGKTCRAFVIARKEGQKVYAIELSGSSLELTPGQIEKLYTGAKGS